MNVVIYDWGTRPDFLLRRLYPNARLVPAPPFSGVDRFVRGARENSRSPNLWFFHLNISLSERWLPRRNEIIAALNELGCRVVNGHVVDIRKSAVQRTNRELGLADVMATRDDDPSMKVIVKTDYNYGGICEGRLLAREARRLGLRPVDGCSIRSFDQYFVCRICDVDAAVWTDERLVVEKYIENNSNLLCRFYRCGSRAVLSEVANEDVIKKMVPGLPRQNWCFDFGDEGPPNYQVLVSRATDMCKALMLEFGTLDIVVDEDRLPYIVDVNPTPGWGAETQSEMTDFLVDGFQAA